MWKQVDIYLNEIIVLTSVLWNGIVLKRFFFFTNIFDCDNILEERM